MRKFEIYAEICLGFSHCGGVYEDNTGELSLTEEDIKVLYDVMEKEPAEDEDTDLQDLDLRATDLEETHPDLYRKIYDAYYDCAREANFAHWTVKGYEEYYVVEEMDWDRALEICKERYGYTPEAEVEYEDDGWDDDDEESEYDPRLDRHFRQWFKNEVIYNTERLLELEREESLLGVDADEFDFDCPLLIPAELVEEFLKSVSFHAGNAGEVGTQKK